METRKIRTIAIFLFISVVLLTSVYAQGTSLKPILYGQIFNGNASVDGAIVTVYPFVNSSDNLTDTVGVGGNVNLSSYYQVNSVNLIFNLSVILA